jgi:hypothetical protein
VARSSGPEQTVGALPAAYRESPAELTGHPAIRRIGLVPRAGGTRELRVALHNAATV